MRTNNLNKSVYNNDNSSSQKFKYNKKKQKK